MTNVYEFSHRDIEGHELSLASFAGKVLLIVNVASRCGFTPQYAGLEELYRSYRERGLVVLGFPCNQFAGQEPGTEAEIQQFCATTYDVTFPMFQKLDVNGPTAHPLYAWLTAQETAAVSPGPVKWNFGKFLIGKDGALLARYGTTTLPNAERVVADIEQALEA